MKTAYFNRFELSLPDTAVEACSHPGRCDDDVAFWASQLMRRESITPALLAAELKEYGTWDDDELSDDDANWRRIIWIAAGQIADIY